MSKPAPRGFDPVSAVMAIATTLVLCAIAWKAFAPTPHPPPPTVGMNAPPLRLRDPFTKEPQFWVAPRGRITWLSFVSLNHPQGIADLTALQKTWRKLDARSAFSALAIVCDDVTVPETLSLPIALATETTRRTFLSTQRELQMLHYLVDEEGKIVVVARGSGATLDRLIALAVERLKTIAPIDRSRFADINDPIYTQAMR